jgi:HPt (histidine-containing phosphotransfer) domain-containing protein
MSTRNPSNGSRRSSGDRLTLDVEMPVEAQLDPFFDTELRGTGRAPRSESLIASSSHPAGRAFDERVLLERMGGDRELFGMAIESFLGAVVELERQVRGAMERGDAPALALAAHSFRGMAATFEAIALVGEARRLELLGRDGDISGARGALPDFERELRRLVAELQSVA